MYLFQKGKKAIFLSNILKVSGSDGHVIIRIDNIDTSEESAFGGYEIEAKIEINVPGYSAIGDVWFTTENLKALNDQLNECQNFISSYAQIISPETHLQMEFKYSSTGQVKIKGKYAESFERENELTFEISSDQSYISGLLSQIQNFLKSI